MKKSMDYHQERLETRMEEIPEVIKKIGTIRREAQKDK